MYQEFLQKAETFIFVEDEPEPADVIFVPGNGYPQMAERAAELYRAGFAPYVLPSGRFSIVEGRFAGVLAERERYGGDYDTEWAFLRDVLLKNGVPEEAILREDRATYTYENALCSRQSLEEAGLRADRALLCCKSYHARRCLMYYQTVFPQARILVCPAAPDGITRENWRESEAGIDAVMGEITRIVKQFSLMMKKEPFD